MDGGNQGILIGQVSAVKTIKYQQAAKRRLPAALVQVGLGNKPECYPLTVSPCTIKVYNKTLKVALNTLSHIRQAYWDRSTPLSLVGVNPQRGDNK